MEKSMTPAGSRWQEPGAGNPRLGWQRGGRGDLCRGAGGFREHSLRRGPRQTPLYRIVEDHYERFEQVYQERYADKYGHFRRSFARRYSRTSTAVT